MTISDERFRELVCKAGPGDLEEIRVRLEKDMKRRGWSSDTIRRVGDMAMLKIATEQIAGFRQELAEIRKKQELRKMELKDLNVITETSDPHSGPNRLHYPKESWGLTAAEWMNEPYDTGRGIVKKGEVYAELMKGKGSLWDGMSYAQKRQFVLDLPEGLE